MKQVGLRSYQDIITPEEQERRDTERKLREEYEQEKAEYLAEVAELKDMVEEHEAIMNAYEFYNWKMSFVEE